MKAARFTSLYSNGPIFPEAYQPKNYSLNNEKLSSLAEEMLWNAARYIEHDEYWNKLVGLGNFWNCLQPELTVNQQKLAFPTAFMPTLKKMKAAQGLLKDQKKQLTKEDKAAIKLEKETLKDTYGTALLDGEKVQICNYQIEPPGIIMTRGADPRFGNWKYRVQPQDVQLNIVNAKPPKTWKGKVYSDNSTIYVYRYKVRCGVKGSSTYKELNKAVAFYGTVDIRKKNTENKFDQTADILKNWTKIQKHIYNGCVKGNEAALIAYLIQQTGIRIGNMRDPKTQADTRGASTLKVENVRLFIS
jgi:DNA topoisomerase-1